MRLNREGRLGGGGRATITVRFILDKGKGKEKP